MWSPLVKAELHAQSHSSTHILNTVHWSVLLPCRKGARHPINSFVQTITSCGTGRLDKPLTVPRAIQTEFLSDLSGWHCIWQILLVSKHQNNCISHFGLTEHLFQFFSSIFDPVSVIAVHNIN